MRSSRNRFGPMIGGISVVALAAATLLPGGVAAQDEIQHGGTLVVAADGTSFPANLNPALNTSNGAVYISGKVVETLAEAGYDGLQPRLATSWEDRTTVSRSRSTSAMASSGATGSRSRPRT